MTRRWRDENAPTTCVKGGTMRSPTWLATTTRRCGVCSVPCSRTRPSPPRPCYRICRGQPPAKRVKRSVHQQQQRLKKLCCDTKTVEATLRAIGHCVRLLLFLCVITQFRECINKLSNFLKLFSCLNKEFELCNFVCSSHSQCIYLPVTSGLSTV